MRMGTVLAVGAVVVGAVLLAGGAKAEPAGSSSTPVPRNLTILRTNFDLLRGTRLVQHVQAGGSLVAAVFDGDHKASVERTAMAAAQEAPSVEFVIAPVGLLLDVIPQEQADLVPDGLRWAVAGAANATATYRRVSTDPGTQEEIDSAMSAAVLAAQGMPADSFGDGLDPLSAWLLWQAGKAPPAGPTQPPIPEPEPDPTLPPDRPDGGPGPIEPEPPDDDHGGDPSPPDPKPTGPGIGGAAKPIAGVVNERTFRYVFEQWSWTVQVRKNKAGKWDWWITPPSSKMAVKSGRQPTQARAEAKAIEGIKAWDTPLHWDTVIGEGLSLHVRRKTNTIWGWWVTQEGVQQPLAEGEAPSQDEAKDDAAVASYKIATGET